MARKDKDEWDSSHVARRICVGFIMSTEYIQRVLPFWKADLMSNELPRLVCGWCLDYYSKYDEAPREEIKSLFEDHKKDLDDDTTELAEIMLESLQDEFDRVNQDGEQIFNVEYLLDQTKIYFQEQSVRRHTEELEAKLERGEITQAEADIIQYTPANADKSSYIDPFAKGSEAAFRAAFSEKAKPLIKYAWSLGEFWNNELTRGSFVAICAPEKSYKTWMQMELAIRAARSGCNVAFFQAGDMTENQFLRRLAIHMARRSDQERFCKNVWEPMIDCVHHQRNECTKRIREPYTYSDSLVPQDNPSFDALKDAFALCPDHSPCSNCKESDRDGMKGAIWLRPKKDVDPLTAQEAEKEAKKFRRYVKGRLRVSTHANETLTVTAIKAMLNAWERQDGFVVDVVVIDYADILAPCPDFGRLEFRHQQNRIWQRLRSLSQERHCLLVTATQAKALSFKKELLDRSDFSEDKRKWAHCTFAVGLNQTPEEKRLGIIRINSLLARESDMASDRPVHVLQRIQIGRPVLGSYW